MPHAPILIPAVAGERAARIRSTIAAMREAVRRAIATDADVVVVISPHAPRKPEAFGIWTGERLRGTLERVRRARGSRGFSERRRRLRLKLRIKPRSVACRHDQSTTWRLITAQ